MVDKYAPQAIWGRELRHYRQAAGLTQAQLAQKIHFSEGLISGVETGQLPASPEFAQTCDTTLETGGALHRLLDWRRGQRMPSWFGKWRDKTRDDPQPPAFRCVIDEAVLHRPIGGPDVMHEQLDHLISMVSPRLSVQVVPHGLHSGLMGGFAIATLEGGIELLYVETAVRGITTSEHEDVVEAVERFEAIRTEALPLSMSVDLIKRTAEERWT